MFESRTDLAIEAHEIAAKNKGHLLDGIIYNEENGAYKVTNIEIISEKGKELTGKAIGKYITVDTGKIWDRGSVELEDVCTKISSIINSLTTGSENALVIGLGNTDVTADAIGPLSIEHLIVTRHLIKSKCELFNDFFELSALSPGVLSQTGIESAEIVKSIVEKLKPDIVIAIDALASGDVSRLGSVIQISNAGIAPGSGVGNRRPELSRDSLGVPVIAIGLPTVVDAVTLSYNVMSLCGIESPFTKSSQLDEYKNMFVTPKDCDKIISFMAKVIGYSINMAFHKNLSFEEMVSLGS